MAGQTFSANWILVVPGTMSLMGKAAAPRVADSGRRGVVVASAARPMPGPAAAETTMDG
jgi:hypothetical protein